MFGVYTKKVSLSRGRLRCIGDCYRHEGSCVYAIAHLACVLLHLKIRDLHLQMPSFTLE